MQYTAEYCIQSPSDPGCEFFVPYFLRTVGAAEIEFHAKNVGTITVCGSGCVTCSPGAVFLSATEEDSVLRVQLQLETDQGVFEVCAAGEPIARVEVSHVACAGLVGGICEGVCVEDPSS
jgi:hypothetical protein